MFRHAPNRPQSTDIENCNVTQATYPVPKSFSPEPLSPTTPFNNPTSPLMPTIPEVDSRARSLDIMEEKTGMSDAGSTTAASISTGLGNPAARARWSNAVKSVTVMLRSASAASGGFNMPSSPRRQRTMSSDGSRGVRKVTDFPPEVIMKASRVAALVPRLKSLETTQDLAAHQALVRHLQFSPNGNFLATSRSVNFLPLDRILFTGLHDWVVGIVLRLFSKLAYVPCYLRSLHNQLNYIFFG